MIRSLLEQDAAEAPARVADLLRTAAASLDALAARLRIAPPPFVATIARGSSDHAANYGRYLIASRLGWVGASLAPSLVTLHAARPRVAGALVLALSQSGQSPDLVAVTAAARAAGALTAAFVNAPSSPLAAASEVLVPLMAGQERSVAASKSFIAQLVAMAALIARLDADRALIEAVERLPEALELARQGEWSAAAPMLAAAPSAIVVARGLGSAIAGEWALKLVETAGLPALHWSAAELLHGPLALAGPGTTAFVLALDDPTLSSVGEAARRLKGLGARLIVAGDAPVAPGLADVVLPLPKAPHPALAPILAALAFYPLVAELARRRGRDPDRPPHLAKVTQTL